MLYLAALQVQSELKRKWRSLRLKRYIGRDYRLHSSSISRNGTENMAQFHRNSRAQSFLQTETTVMWDIQKLNESRSYFTAPRLTTQYFSKALRWRGRGFLKHEIEMQERRWGFSISEAQRCISVYNAKSPFIANFAINHQNSTLNQTSVSGIVLVALKTTIPFLQMQITYTLLFVNSLLH